MDLPAPRHPRGIVLVAIQFVPHGRNHTNPLPVKEPNWDSAAARTLAVDGCFGYHSNLTKWPRHTDVAPISWLVTRDVEDGRAVLNSRSGRGRRTVTVKDVIDASRNRGMLPIQYRLIHKEARLTDAQR